MSRIVVSQFITIDGVVEGPGGGEDFDRQGWAFKFSRGDDGDKYKLDETMAADALLLGRKTYEGFAAAWPGRTDDVGFADKYNGMPKYVVSTTLTDPDWNNSHVINGDVPAEIVKLKDNTEGDLLVNGSVTLVKTLLANDLVDELRLMVFPTILGAGKRMFGDADSATSLRLTDSQAVGPDGVFILTYEPKRD